MVRIDVELKVGVCSMFILMIEVILGFIINLKVRVMFDLMDNPVFNSLLLLKIKVEFLFVIPLQSISLFQLFQ